MRKGTLAPPPPQYNHHLHDRSRGKIWSANLTRTVAYIALLLLSYSFGRYMSRVPLSSTSVYPEYSQSSALMSTATSTQSDDENNYIHVGHNLKEQEQEMEPDQHNYDADVKSEDHNVFGTVCAAEPVTDSKLVRNIIIDRVFNGISPWNNFPPSHVASLLKTTKVQGWGSRGAVFSNLIQKVRPKTIIEVGTFLGASALHMVELTRQLGIRDAQILCVDDFRGWPGFQNERWSKSNDIKMLNGDVMLLYQFMQNVVHTNATESVIFLPFSTGSALDKLCKWGVLGDLIEVDAGHDFHSAWSDINRAYKILRPGGVLFGHDYLTSADNRGVRRAVNLFAKIKNLRVRVDGQHWVLHEYSDE